jgi:hypothetical protein
MVWKGCTSSDFQSPPVGRNESTNARAKSFSRNFFPIARATERLQIRFVESRAAARDRSDVIDALRSHLSTALYAHAVVGVQLAAEPLTAPRIQTQPRTRDR